MKCTYSCNSPDHQLARRGFLAGIAATATGGALGGLGFFTRPLAAAQLQKDQKRVVLFNMHGGLSQLESWDPKPGTETGGPFRAISTSVPGIQISELLPNVAKQMHHLCLLRGVNTSEDDHGKGAYLMTTGRRQTPAAEYPVFGAVCARAMASEDGSLPGHIVITPGGGGGRGNDAAYLGPKYSSIYLGNGNPPQYTKRPGNVSEADRFRPQRLSPPCQRSIPLSQAHGCHRSVYVFVRAGASVDGAERRLRRQQGAGQGSRALWQVRPRPPLPAGTPAAREGRDVRSSIPFELRHA